MQVDGWLQRFAELTDRKVAAAPGAGAGGGIGFALQLLGVTASRGSRSSPQRSTSPDAPDWPTWW
nr:glycerate kinase [Nocardioides alcanivorans]